MSCKDHCWCAYSPNSEIVRRLGAEHIVELMIRTPHEHDEAESCSGCLNKLPMANETEEV